MSRVQPMQTAYNGGELSPFMDARPDHEIWPVAVQEMVGFVPRPQGPAEACPGFEYIATAEGECRLIPFEPYTTQGYVIEASADIFRFFTNDVLLESGGSPVEVSHPYTMDQVNELWHERSNDVLYLFHKDRKHRLLTRTAASAFSLTELELENGPFLDRNSDEDHRLSFNGVTGTVTVSSNQPLFASTDVGRMIEVEAEDLSDIPSWEPGITVSLGDLLQWDGRVYQVVGQGTGTARTGTVQPVHTHGVEWDGMGKGQDLNENDAGGVQLQYMHDMYGRLKIVSYVSNLQVTATVTRRLPLQLATSYLLSDYHRAYYTPDASGSYNTIYTTPGTGSYTSGTWRWRLGAYSDSTGWPSAGIIWNQRLFLFKDDRIDASVAGSLHDFDRLNEYGEISADQAFSLQIDDPNPITWAAKGLDLFIGTATSEYVLRPASAAQPLGPGNTDLKRQTDRGGAQQNPVMLNGRPIYAQRQRRCLMHLIEDTYGRYTDDDLNRYADHVLASPVTDMCWQKQPLQLLWAVREDGTLACADYMPKENVLGWSRRPLADGLVAESICSITAPDGLTDQLWVSARSGSERFVMLLDEWRQPLVDAELPLMLDAGLRYDGSSGDISTLTLAHLPNTDVEVMGDGKWLGTFTTDASGDVDLGQSVTTAVAGLKFDAYVTRLPFEAGGDNGPAQFKMQRASRYHLRVYRSLGLEVEFAGRTERIGNVREGDLLAGTIDLFTGDIALDMVGDWDRGAVVGFRRYAPFPCTVLGDAAIVDTAQR